MNTPKFSVIIPARNEEKVIERAIKSVQNQTFQDFEIIVSNDGSTDKTRKIVERLMKKDKRIKILNRDKGHSAAFARNRGAEIAKGEIFVFLDADAYIEKNCFEEILKREKKADAFIFPCVPIRTSKINKMLEGFYKPIIFKEKIYDKSNKNRPLFFCCKSFAYRETGGYDEGIFYFEDKDFCNKFYKKDFKAMNFNTTKQYFELPSTFAEFIRQCKWIGKGINTIKNKQEKRSKKRIWFLKALFLLSPLFFLFNLNLFLLILIITLLITYVGLILRNKKPLLSLITLPFLYIKTFLVSFNILRFWG